VAINYSFQIVEQGDDAYKRKDYHEAERLEGAYSEMKRQKESI